MLEGLEWLPRSTIRRIEDAVRAVERALGEQLVAVALVGAAVFRDRPDRAQAPELLVVAKSVSLPALRQLAREARDSMRHQVRLRVLTTEELARSVDVFTVELAEYRNHHVLLHGDDPFAELLFRPQDLRRSVEQGLRGLGRRVRNRVLAGLTTDGQRDHPQAAVAEGLERLVVLARYALELLDHEVPAGDAALLAAAANVAQAGKTGLGEQLAKIRQGQPLEDPLTVVAELIAVLDPLIAAIDRSGGES